MKASWTFLWVLCITSCGFDVTPHVINPFQIKSGQGPQYTAIVEPFPVFTTEPITRDQCGLQITDHCRPTFLKGYFGNSTTTDDMATGDWLFTDATVWDYVGPHNCTFLHGLQLRCNDNVTPQEIRYLAKSLSLPPQRAVMVNLTDSTFITLENLSPVRQQTIILHLYNCASTRTTGKLVQLHFSNLLNFELHNCYDMVVKKADFWSSVKLRMIQFVHTTLRSLEEGTFTDLPALRLLSLERGFSDMEVFSDHVKQFLQSMHCGCEYEWFRKWWRTNQLLRSASRKEIFHIATHSWHNEPATNRDVYVPIDCAADPFPNGSGFINFEQNAYSTNDNIDLKKTCEGKADDEWYPAFQTEPPTEAECGTSLPQSKCMPLIVSQWWRCPDSQPTNTTFDAAYCVPELRVMSATLAKLPPRPLSMVWPDDIPVAITDLGDVRRHVIFWSLQRCTNPRTTHLLYTLRLSSLLSYEAPHCTDLEIRNVDFQHISRLRVLLLYNSTVRTLETDAFSNLPSLRVLTLEDGIRTGREVEGYGWDMPTYDQRIRSYLFRLHCTCEFAWYREWRANDSALLQTAEPWELWYLTHDMDHGLYLPTDDYVPIVCSQPIPHGPEGLDANQTVYSLHVPAC